MKVRVVLIDSGVTIDHPHLRDHSVSFGTSFVGSDPSDDLGHGTCAAAAVLDLAPMVELISLKVFDRTPTAPLSRLLEALDHGLALDPLPQAIVLPLGFRDRSSIEEFQTRVDRAVSHHIQVVAPLLADGLPSYPGSLSGAVGVIADAALPRENPQQREDGWAASPYPRDLPGLPRERNLQGVSFAACNVAGFLARQAADAFDR